MPGSDRTEAEEDNLQDNVQPVISQHHAADAIVNTKAYFQLILRFFQTAIRMIPSKKNIEK
jgi:hypothetical protein